MKNTEVFLIFLFLFSCAKDETVNSNISNQDDIYIDNTTSCALKQSEIPNWQNTSYELFDIYYPQNYLNLGSLLNNQWGGESGEYGLNVISVDYNNDGYMDIIGSYNDYSNFIDYPSDYYGYERKQLIRFYKGNCEGNFEVDELNDSKFLGLVHGRKILLGDFNNDNYVDLFLLGHGYDKQPFNGEFNKVLMSNGDGGFFDVDYKSFESFYHGGASGDIDNDGDLDIVAVDGGRGKSLIYKNLNGQLEPDETLIDQTLMDQMYNAELFDINNDGFIDLIAGGHDWSWNQNPECEYWECNTYDNAPVIIYGDGIDFIDNSYVRLPQTSIYKQGIVTNFEFFDFDGNGQVEIILTRTGDNMNETPGLPWDQTNFYKDWSVQVLEFNGQDYDDATLKYIDVNYGEEQWIRFTKIKDIDNDGILEMYNTSNPYIDQNNYLEWKIISGKLIKQ
ncbi:MAG: VCBS repeat-containing protein [Candidatus Neomarinimicrobiota bacterium]